ncbi:MAG: type II toxin-antitoxin system ParD family antitoxin [Gammaproteobacteria bacterium]|jgi:antitoxin ParD1/3/4|nr:type II toxin-antitoxin system ParD family antitoxin [Gammaproteobacteria bacterium]
MPTRNVVLTEQQEIFVGKLVEAGRYQNASEVLRDGLRLLEDRVRQRDAELEDIRAGVVAGFDQVGRGEFAEGSGEEAIERAFKRAVCKHGR